MSYKKIFSIICLLAACFLPLIWRIVQHGGQGIPGMFSDAGLAVFILTAALYLPHWLRVFLMIIWALCQMIGQELLAALYRLPAWQDLHYLTDADFVTNTTAGFKLAEPFFAFTCLLVTLPLIFISIPRPRKRWLGGGMVFAFAIFCLQYSLNKHDSESSMAARYNPLHWFVQDALRSTLFVNKTSSSVLKAVDFSAKIALPSGLKELDLSGESLLNEKGSAPNVLIIILEGIPGLYHPEVRQAMGIKTSAPEMPELISATSEAMLIPDFTVHSHQTIRGLYALLCGDFSDLSWKTPKAFELQRNPEYAKQCLPQQMAQYGWSTHFLQGADLGFMNKGQVMPLIGFQQVHGAEWFNEVNPFPFIWGPIDEIFFRGAYQYIINLQQQQKPWMLALLNVGTHQPYGVSDAVAKKYFSRKLASVALLDEAVAVFLKKLKADGILDNTLIVIVPDESHGSEFGDWTSSWGLALVMAPEQKQLPRLKQGGYGLVDVEASVLDYLNLPAPPRLIGRSFFRDYTEPREMISFAASKLRWHRTNNMRYECVETGQCWAGRSASLLGAAVMEPDQGYGQRLFNIAAVLDKKVIAEKYGTGTMHFGHGEIRRLPEKVSNEWTDNLIGAQYLDFPEQSTVQVRIRIKALASSQEGIRLWLKFKSWEKEVPDIAAPEFPVLQQGETTDIAFSFENEQARKNFSFHLLGESQGGEIQIETFDLQVTRKNEQ